MGRTVARTCAICAKEFQARAYEVKHGRARFCSKSCQVRDQHRNGVYLGARKGSEHHNWKGGVARSGGYLRELAKDHPRAYGGRYIQQHILVVERIIGRQINKREHVHHIDGNRSNNDPKNLALMSNREHIRLHRLMESAKRRGDKRVLRRLVSAVLPVAVV